MERLRVIYGILLVGTIMAGLASRSLVTVSKNVGDLMYAVAVYLMLRLLWTPLRPHMAGLVALLFCLAIESFKLTGLPAAWRGWAISRLFLGTTPSWQNVFSYGLGVTLAAVADAVLTRKRK